MNALKQLTGATLEAEYRVFARISLIKYRHPWPFLRLHGDIWYAVHNVQARPRGRIHKLAGYIGDGAERTGCGLPVGPSFIAGRGSVTCMQCRANSRALFDLARRRGVIESQGTEQK